ncbi:hypothetical protein ACVDG3_06895 [Meridianimarinicoccus sp. RP-17]|uniref:hypothetical protein n=1 Tax=Meridianimarinicoccus zhengii TaxID=2056810 RepID=UPI000DAC0F04|nr:hypothetical protein [Phycocomes zhengii]
MKDALDRAIAAMKRVRGSFEICKPARATPQRPDGGTITVSPELRAAVERTVAVFRERLE